MRLRDEAIEEPLRERVRVVRPFALRFHAALRRVPIYCRGRRVVQRNSARLRDAEPSLGVLEVVVEHPVDVPDEHVRVGADMEDGLERHRLSGGVELAGALLVVDEIDDPGALEVPPLLGLAHRVHHHDVPAADLVEDLHEVAADQSSAAGDDDHACSPVAQSFPVRKSQRNASLRSSRLKRCGDCARR